MEPWQSWAAILLGGGAIYCYYYGVPGLKENARSAQQHLGSEGTQTRKAQRRDDSKAKQRGDGSAAQVEYKSAEAGASGNDEPAARRKNSKRATTPIPPTPAVTHAEDPGKEEETDIKNWAANLAKLKEGSTLAPPTHTSQRQKTVRQSAANATPDFPSALYAAPADADDELSPAVSPTLQAKISGADVADMVEASSPGPSSLRLTEPTQPRPAKQQRKSASPQPQETKKQRQNRQKVEAKKLEREEQEKARRVLEEKQRRTARESRGEPAKNGVVPAKVPASNSWTQAPANGAIQNPTPNPSNSMPTDTQLLDTFDQDTTASTASSSGRATSPNSNTTAGTNWDGPLPSEEEQLRIISENDDTSWSTVPSGKKNKKKAGPLSNGDAANQVSSDNSVSAQAVSKPSKDALKEPRPASNGGYSVLDTVGDWADSSHHPGDSDWSVV